MWEYHQSKLPLRWNPLYFATVTVTGATKRTPVTINGETLEHRMIIGHASHGTMRSPFAFSVLLNEFQRSAFLQLLANRAKSNPRCLLVLLPGCDLRALLQGNLCREKKAASAAPNHSS